MKTRTHRTLLVREKAWWGKKERGVRGGKGKGSKLVVFARKKDSGSIKLHRKGQNTRQKKSRLLKRMPVTCETAKNRKKEKGTLDRKKRGAGRRRRRLVKIQKKKKKKNARGGLCGLKQVLDMGETAL